MSLSKREFHRLTVSACAGLVLAGTSAWAATPGLAERWAELRSKQPRLPARDAARTLGVSEAELLETRVGTTATRLRDGSDAAREMLRQLPAVGEFMALTRNDAAVIETTGVPRPLPARMTQPTGDAAADEERRIRMRNVVGYLGGPIDLRTNFEHWSHAFAVVQPGAEGKTSRSLQFFDAQGDAVFKAYLVDGSDVTAFERIGREFTAPATVGALAVKPAPARPAVKPDSAIDAAEWRRVWNELQDVHEFSRMLNDFGVERQQGFRLAPPGKAIPLEPQAIRPLLQGAAAQQVAIMAFVGNKGLTEIFSGKIEKVQEVGGYFNVLDPKFNLHLRDKAFRNAWLIDRGGIVSVEFFDDQGVLAVSFFGVHGRGEPQPKPWKDLVGSLPRLPG